MSCNQCIQLLGLLGAWFRRKEVDRAAAVGLCCHTMHQCTVFWVSYFARCRSTTQVGKQSIVISYFLSNISAKIVIGSCTSITASRKWDVFWDTVYISHFPVTQRPHFIICYNRVWRQRPQCTVVWGSDPSGSICRAPDRGLGAKPSWIDLKAFEHLGVKRISSLPITFPVFCKFSSTDECWYDTLHSCCKE